MKVKGKKDVGAMTCHSTHGKKGIMFDVQRRTIGGGGMGCGLLLLDKREGVIYKYIRLWLYIFSYYYSEELSMKKKISASLFVATWFRSGLIRPIFFRGMAGTYGSFFALPLCFLSLIFAWLVKEPWGVSGVIVVYSVILLFVFIQGLLVVSNAEEELGPQKDWKGKIKERDQNQIVIDEVLGMLVSCVPILFVSDYTILHFAFAFIFFRIFDIVKIPPTRFFDRMKNAFGVMMDDVVAGVQAALVLQILIVYVL